MAMRRITSVLLALVMACSGTPRVVSPDTHSNEPTVFLPRTSEVEPVQLDEEDFSRSMTELVRQVRPAERPLESARRMFGVPPRSGSYRFEADSQRVVPDEEDGVLSAGEELAHDYAQWCARRGKPRDCLRLLERGTRLDADGKSALAMAFAVGAVWEETKETLGEAVDFEAMFATVVGALTMYCILLVVPELASKGVAAMLTAALVGYLGVDAVWSLFGGWRRMMEEVEGARTFSQVRAAGERFGRVMGRNAARVFVLLVTVALGNTAAGFAGKVPTLPGAGQAVGLAGVRGGVGLEVVGAVEAVAITAEGATLTLAPSLMLKGRGQGGGDAGGSPRPNGHRSWESSSGLRKALGPAGEGKEWHHLVEQTPGNIERFGPRAIHNTENVIALEKMLHARVSALYSSIRENITGSNTLTVRAWLRTQSYEEQRRFGLIAIENVRRGIW